MVLLLVCWAGSLATLRAWVGHRVVPQLRRRKARAQRLQLRLMIHINILKHIIFCQESSFLAICHRKKVRLSVKPPIRDRLVYALLLCFGLVVPGLHRPALKSITFPTFLVVTVGEALSRPILNLLEFCRVSLANGKLVMWSCEFVALWLLHQVCIFVGMLVTGVGRVAPDLFPRDHLESTVHEV